MKTLKYILQKIRIYLGKLLLDKSTPTQKITYPQKILFLRQDGKIGDYIVSSFVFRELKKYNPNLHIGVICDTKQVYLFERNPYIDQCHIVRNKHILDYIRCGIHLKKLQYDTVIDPTVLIRNRDLLLLRLIQAKQYVGYKKEHYKIFNFNVEGNFHFSELYKLAVEKVGISIQDIQYDIPNNHNANLEVKEYLNRHCLENYISINFFGAARSRKINDENIANYIRYLQKIVPNRPLVLLSYPEVEEKLLQISHNEKNVFVFSTKNIFHTIELIRYADWLISPDTSTIHIASGLNKNIIALYGDNQENFRHWKPMSKAETHVLFYKENINEIMPEQIKAEWLSK